MTIELISSLLREYNLKLDKQEINNRLKQVCDSVYNDNKTELKKEMFNLRLIKRELQF